MTGLYMKCNTGLKWGNTFHASASFLYYWFTDVFRGYRNDVTWVNSTFKVKTTKKVKTKTHPTSIDNVKTKICVARKFEMQKNFTHHLSFYKH